MGLFRHLFQGKKLGRKYLAKRRTILPDFKNFLVGKVKKQFKFVFGAFAKYL
jgi:hypothetical protein